MKIFISHSSKNKEYGELLVDFLRDIGLKEEEIIFTSNVIYGIPIGENIFQWLKKQITERPFVIYLLSQEYFRSIPCLNEMGAAWIIENQHAMIFTPNFKLDSPEFLNGVLDPKEMGFYINDEFRLHSFSDQLKNNFNITTKSLIVSSAIKKLLQNINKIQDNRGVENSQYKKSTDNNNVIDKDNSEVKVSEDLISQKSSIEPNIYNKFLTDIRMKKLKDEELLLLKYIIFTGKSKLGVGWQTEGEVKYIKEWEIINDLNNTLSKNYSLIINRFELREYSRNSDFTSHGNPKEIKIKDEIAQNILDLPSDILQIIEDAYSKNINEKLPF